MMLESPLVKRDKLAKARLLSGWTPNSPSNSRTVSRPLDGDWFRHGDLYQDVARRCGTPLLSALYTPESVVVFDTCVEHARRLFEAVCDEDEDNVDRTYSIAMRRERTGGSAVTAPITMDFDQFVRALEYEKFEEPEAKTVLLALWNSLETNDDDEIDMETFHACLRRLKLHVLCLKPVENMDMEPLPEECGFVGHVDWCPLRFVDMYHEQPENPLDFLFRHRDADIKCRWVHCVDASEITLLRLSVKYQLHPLAVKDTIALDQKFLPVVRKYTGQTFVVLTMLRLAAKTKRELRALQADGGRLDKEPSFKSRSEPLADPEFITTAPHVEQCQLALFVAGAPSYDTLVSVKTKWRLGRLFEGEAYEADPADPWDPAEPIGSPTTDDTPGKGSAFDGSDIFNPVVREIQRDFSLLRAGDATWLMWRLLDITFDELQLIVVAYRAQMDWLSNEILRQESQVSESVEKRLFASKAELDWLQRKTRPAVGSLKHLVQDKTVSKNVEQYLTDVEDHLTTFIDEVSGLIQTASSLLEEIVAYRNQQQQRVLYVLALITVMVMPTHLLTGMYGMNFQDDAGDPVAPGLGILLENRGYVLFWGFALMISISLYLLFSRWLRWI